MGPIIEAYATGFKRLVDLIRAFLNALGCLMMHIVVITASPIFFLTITFYTIVTTLVGFGPRQGFRLCPFMPKHTSPTLNPGSSNESSNSSDLLSFSHVDGSLPQNPHGRVKSASVGDLHITSPNPPPASPDYPSLPPAIPPHLKDCEFYYNDVNIDHVEKSPTFGFTGHPVVRINIDGVTHVCMHGRARYFLENLEDKMTVIENDDGESDLIEEKRGMLEMRDRVYVGPVQWLVRILIEEV